MKVNLSHSSSLNALVSHREVSHREEGEHPKHEASILRGLNQDNLVTGSQESISILRTASLLDLCQSEMKQPANGDLLTEVESLEGVVDAVEPSLEEALDQWVEESPENEKRMRVVARAMILSCAHNGSSVLKLTGCQLTSLPNCIRTLTHLKKLFLDQNQLSSLPKSIGSMLNLTELDMSNNQFQAMPVELLELRSLKVLNMAGNHLISLPENIDALQSLTRLDLSRNRMRQIPDALSQMDHLLELNCAVNQLASIPESLLSAKNQLCIDLQFNLLPPETVIDLTHRLDRADYEGPEVAAGGFDEFVNYRVNTSLSLKDNVDFWLQESGSDIASTWTDEDDTRVEDFNLLLNRLRTIKDFDNPTARAHLQKKLREVLSHMDQSAEFRDLVYDLSESAVSTCQDGVAMGFDDICLAHLVDQYKGERPSRNLMKLGEDLMLLSSIKDIATATASEREIADELEVCLAYQVGLRDLFSMIDIESEMLWGHISGIDQRDIDQAREQLAQKMNPDAVREFVINWTPWQEACDRAESVKNTKEQFILIASELFDAKEEMQESQFIQKNSELISARDGALKEIYGQFVDNVSKEESLKAA